IIHVLRTRSPVYSPLRAFSLDLHVLGTPPAFVLSQDQTLQLSIGVSFLAHRHHAPRLTEHDCALKALRSSAILLRGLALQFSETDQARPSRSALPTTSPSRRLEHPGEGRYFLPLPLLRAEGIPSVPARTPYAAGVAGCSKP